MDLNVRAKTIKLLRENIEGNLCHLKLGKALDIKFKNASNKRKK